MQLPIRRPVRFKRVFRNRFSWRIRTVKLPVVYHPDYVTSLPEGHRFPMAKFRRVFEIVRRVIPEASTCIHRPPVASRKWLYGVHDREYVDRFCEGRLDGPDQRRTGLPWSEGLVRRTKAAVGGAVFTARLALRHGLACNTAGGTHHAHKSRGSGFCIFNDLAVAARMVQQTEAVNRVLIVDCDVHQGDGTAALFQGDPSVFTYSIHCRTNFPFEKQTSDRDVELEPGTGNDGYMKALRSTLPGVLRRVDPELVLYDAGVDPHRDDLLGRLTLDDEGIRRRDRWVLSRCIESGIPVGGLIGGGYDEIEPLSHRHTILHRVARSLLDQLVHDPGAADPASLNP